MRGTVGFTRERLSEALEARGVSGAALAQMIGITPMAVYQYVRGETSPRPETMHKICQTLNFPESFFKKPIRRRSDDDQEKFWRSFSSATKSSRLQAGRRFRWVKEIVEYLNATLEFPAVNLPAFDLPPDPLSLDSDDVEHLANELRAFWHVGDGPISNLTLLLENNGIIVSQLTMGTERIDAFSQWSDTDKLPYIVLATDKRNGVRNRSDAGHELGHLAVHRLLDNSRIRKSSIHKEVEKQAFRFGSAFLLPEDQFLSELWAPTLDAFRSLKSRWKVAIGMMIHRCADLRVITEDQAKRLWINYNRRKWKKKEPLDDDIQIEQPRLLRRSMELLVNEGVKTPQAILEELSLPMGDVAEICQLSTRFFTGEDRVVQMPRLRNMSDAGQEKQHDTHGKIIQFKPG